MPSRKGTRLVFHFAWGAAQGQPLGSACRPRDSRCVGAGVGDAHQVDRDRYRRCGPSHRARALRRLAVMGMVRRPRLRSIDEALGRGTPGEWALLLSGPPPPGELGALPGTSAVERVPVTWEERARGDE